MAGKKIVVPAEMFQAAWSAALSYIVKGENYYGVKAGLEAALLWLSNNPIVPSGEQWKEISQDAPPTSTRMPYDWVLKEWQSRMFLAPGPEVSEASEEIKDLRKMMSDYFNHSDGYSYPDDLLIEAYRRGKEGR